MRASALELVPAYLTPELLKSVQGALTDTDSLVRRAALSVLESLDSRARVSLALPLLSDPVRSVRTQAARVLAAVPGEAVPEVVRPSVSAALAEWEADQRFNADRAEGRLNLAWLYLQQGEAELAEKEYLEALDMAPWFAATYVNLADLYRGLGRDDEGMRLLRNGLEAVEESAEIHHALGLLLVRESRLPEALSHLETAARLRPESSRYGYVHGIALNTAGDTAGALTALEKAHRSFPADRETLTGLVSIHRDNGSIPEALRYARKLRDLLPGEPNIELMIRQLEGQS